MAETGTKRAETTPITITITSGANGYSPIPIDSNAANGAGNTAPPGGGAVNDVLPAYLAVALLAGLALGRGSSGWAPTVAGVLDLDAGGRRQCRRIHGRDWKSPGMCARGQPGYPFSPEHDNHDCAFGSQLPASRTIDHGKRPRDDCGGVRTDAA